MRNVLFLWEYKPERKRIYGRGGPISTFLGLCPLMLEIWQRETHFLQSGNIYKNSIPKTTSRIWKYKSFSMQGVTNIQFSSLFKKNEILLSFLVLLSNHYNWHLKLVFFLGFYQVFMQWCSFSSCIDNRGSPFRNSGLIPLGFRTWGDLGFVSFRLNR